ncbi:hypothetical protein GCM10025879_14900 [Leuconostoc litchii]|uniref:YtxH domain-containing protein n=1 Tax=Leuconostoc litchii TaxID=1981069 RepID=A0A652NEA1_9LACO|nr:hypothetical protein [Leuconostoc litchii]TYC46449.1 hypothetical protein ESZ47_06245 [Leuconostoc litchii]GMA70244.1 hypothetical protein GCM10025879_14900 [Leuconostoc litchii]
MSKVKGIVAGILVTVAAYAAYKALPKKRQEELSEKAQQTGSLIRDKAYDVAYEAADIAADVTEKAKEKTAELKANSQEKYGEHIDIAAEKIKDFTDQATPYVDKAKGFVTPYIEKTQDAITDLRDKLVSEDIELTQDDVDLEDALADLADDENIKKNDTVSSSEKSNSDDVTKTKD